MNSQIYELYISRTLLIISTILLGFLSAFAVSAEGDANTNRTSGADFDGDGKADISVFRPSNGFWYVMNSSGGFSAVQWGLGTDQLVPGDYDGDGKTDLAVYRRGARPDVGSNVVDYDYWYVLKSSDSALFSRQGRRSGGFGGDRPIPADYDGDGKTDITTSYFSDSLGSPIGFKILQSSTNSGIYRQWGFNTDRLIPADYDGDGKADLAVFRDQSFPDTTGFNTWYILQSSNGAMRAVQFGLPTDRLVPSDYDGDGKADIAVYRQSNGFWYIQNRNDDSFSAVQFGAPEDKPVPADYDGDGKTDIAVYRPSNGTWYLRQSKNGFAAYAFGLPDDIPIPNGYVY